MKLNKQFFLALVLILVGIASRFIFVIDGTSILPNVSAVGAVALFGATYLKGMTRWIVPITLLWISDLVLNNVFYAQYYEGFQVMGSMWVYGAFVVTGVLGYLMMRKPSWVRLGLSAFMASVVFFVITNIGAWITLPMYTKDVTGLVACFTLAIPFFINTLLGNLLYGYLLFGLYEWVASRSSMNSVLGIAILAK